MADCMQRLAKDIVNSDYLWSRLDVDGKISMLRVSMGLPAKERIPTNWNLNVIPNQIPTTPVAQDQDSSPVDFSAHSTERTERAFLPSKRPESRFEISHSSSAMAEVADSGTLRLQESDRRWRESLQKMNDAAEQLKASFGRMADEVKKLHDESEDSEQEIDSCGNRMELLKKGNGQQIGELQKIINPVISEDVLRKTNTSQEVPGQMTQNRQEIEDAHQVFDGMPTKKTVKNSDLEIALCAGPSNEAQEFPNTHKGVVISSNPSQENSDRGSSWHTYFTGENQTVGADVCLQGNLLEVHETPLKKESRESNKKSSSWRSEFKGGTNFSFKLEFSIFAEKRPCCGTNGCPVCLRFEKQQWDPGRNLTILIVNGATHSVLNPRVDKEFDFALQEATVMGVVVANRLKMFDYQSSGEKCCYHDLTNGKQLVFKLGGGSVIFDLGGVLTWFAASGINFKWRRCYNQLCGRFVQISTQISDVVVGFLEDESRVFVHSITGIGFLNSIKIKGLVFDPGGSCLLKWGLTILDCDRNVSHGIEFKGECIDELLLICSIWVNLWSFG